MGVFVSVHNSDPYTWSDLLEPSYFRFKAEIMKMDRLLRFHHFLINGFGMGFQMKA